MPLKSVALRFLVIDDLKEDRDLAKSRILEAVPSNFKIEIDEAESFEEGLRKVKENHYHQIFLDFGLPDVDSSAIVIIEKLLEVLREKNPRLTKTQVLGYTATTQDIIVAAAKKRFDVPIINKSQSDEIVDYVKESLDNPQTNAQTEIIESRMELLAARFTDMEAKHERLSSTVDTINNRLFVNPDSVSVQLKEIQIEQRYASGEAKEIRGMLTNISAQIERKKEISIEGRFNLAQAIISAISAMAVVLLSGVFHK